MEPPGGLETTGKEARELNIRNGDRVGREWSASRPGHRVMRGMFHKEAIEAA
jgi:hypothetical protein